MKKTFIESLKIIAVALVIGWGVSGVSAFTPGSFPNGQVPAVINTSVNNQTKVGGLLSEKFLVSDLGFFTKTLLPGKDSWLNIGSRLNVAPGAINNNGSTIPLTIDVTGRATVTKDGTEGQNAINFISGQTSCSTATAFINDRASAFEFTSGSTDTGHADLIARQLQLSGGSPQDGSVLASDANGNAVWAKLVVQGGVLKVINNQTGFPVVADADCNPPQAVYGWSYGNWSTCSGAAPSDWTDFYPSSSPGWGSVNQSCSSWLAAQSANYSNGIQTRDVVCKDSNGNTVSDSMCTGVKPDSTKSCVLPLQYRVKVTIDGITQSINYTDPGTCLYSKLLNPTSTDPLANIFPLDCQVRTLSQAAPTGGYSPSSNCSMLQFSGGPGYGFNAGNPGGWTATGSASWQMQVKKQ